MKRGLGATRGLSYGACARASRCVEEGGEGDGYGVASKGAKVRGRVSKLGFDREGYIQNSLVYMYSQGGFVGVTRQVFNEMTVRSVASWTFVLMA
ncbi:hypothetical protein CJ030_MR1G027743 [Morella rubra]|uniref:Pentatricopeptide repeat-containing protein n=1 Tax=Morella rubra TaxID=262757 RepID=A0A6A1WTL5_9ROSI|nr:hypothetical protein CJ030_MR1G027743 [Morella rubra]